MENPYPHINIAAHEERISIPLNDNPEASGFIHDLNKKQNEILIKFRERLAKEKIVEDFSYYDDLYLLRFLRARKFDIDKSFLMISDFFKWRQKERVDEAEHFDYHELIEVKKLYPHTYHKTDKMGRPIYIELLGSVKIKELFQITNRDRMMRYYIREYERLMKYRFNACSKISGRLIEQGFSILDLSGVSMSILSGDVKDFIKIASGIGQNYYPEMLGKMFMINTSTMFKFMWSIIKGFIDKKTRNKMTVLKSDYLEELLEYVDRDNLPSILGGNCTCSHIPGGCMFSDIGPWNPTGGISN
jgi:hypothetical protein